MIIDAVEFHEDALPEEKDWTAAAPLLALLFIWAHESGMTSQTASAKEAVHAIDAGAESPSEWVNSCLDFTLTSDVLQPAAVNLIKEFVAGGAYYECVKAATASKNLYGVPDDWSEIRRLVPAVDAAYEAFVVR